jgi:RNA-directed DNA polymerase
VHCRTEAEAQGVRAAIAERLRVCGLELHPEKTKIVYCKDDKRRGTSLHEQFTFLGYTFRPRSVRACGRRVFVGFNPAISDQACKAIREEVRGWRLHRCSALSLEDLSERYNTVIRGWIGYYGCYYRSALDPLFRQLDYSLVRWAMRKYKRLRRKVRRATKWLCRVIRRDSKLFAHWNPLVPLRSTVGAV